MKKRLVSILLLLTIFALLVPGSASAQTYYFRLDALDAHVYWESDGTMSLVYRFRFYNSERADPIDFVDVGVPQPGYSLSNVSATVNGVPVSSINSSPYVANGVEIGLGANAIRPGESGIVEVTITGIRRVLFTDDRDSSYASGVFSTTFFGSEFVFGNTHTTVTFHLPPGVQPDEPRWHSAPAGFPSEPETGIDEQGRIIYVWVNPNASGSREYRFGASFPQAYVIEGSVVRPTFTDRTGMDVEDLMGMLVCGGFFVFFAGVVVMSIISSKKRQLQYLPPKIAIEGHGIKRGLTAIEAAILMEQPMDKILTMILFAVIKKGAATVTKREPLEIEVAQPIPEELHTYEKEFLAAFQVKGAGRKRKLQDTMLNLVKSASGKMKGFSRKETVAYYQDITRKAWAQVQASETPEVMSEKYDEVMEWTMLDRDFDGRTREVFRDRPVIVPRWWGRYDPTFGGGFSGGGAATGGKVAAPAPSGGGGGLSMPTLPGGSFAASMVGGIQNFSSSVIGNVTDFTSSITNKTNPIPKSTSSGGSRSGGGGGCACACACAGCACACAGGGR
jgi:hypothetical protein